MSCQIYPTAMLWLMGNTFVWGAFTVLDQVISTIKVISFVLMALLMQMDCLHLLMETWVKIVRVAISNTSVPFNSSPSELQLLLMSHFCLPPYPRRPLNNMWRIFNYRLSSGGGKWWMYICYTGMFSSRFLWDWLVSVRTRQWRELQQHACLAITFVYGR